MVNNEQTIHACLQRISNTPSQRTCCPSACLFKRTCSPASIKTLFLKADKQRMIFILIKTYSFYRTICPFE